MPRRGRGGGAVATPTLAHTPRLKRHESQASSICSDSHLHLDFAVRVVAFDLQVGKGATLDALHACHAARDCVSEGGHDARGPTWKGRAWLGRSRIPGWRTVGDLEGRERARGALELLFEGVDVVKVDMGIPDGVDEIAGFQTTQMGEQASEEGV